MKTSDAPSEFYIGYQKKAPAGLARAIRTVVLFALVISLSAMAVFALMQQSQRAGFYEFGVPSQIEGTFRAEPVPTVTVAQSSHERALPGQSVILTGETKHGITEDVLALDGQSVSFEGALLYDATTTMLEVWSAEVGVDEAPREPTAAQTGKTVTLTGELVDTKCFVGAMRPGYGKTHRGCAIVCLEGGVPPGLWISGDTAESGRLVFLEAETSVTIVPQWAGYLVTATGMLSEIAGVETLLVSRIDRASE